MERNTMELPLPPEQKQLARIEELADKARAVQEIIQEYENNIQTTADLQCEIMSELKKGNTDISLLKAVKAISLMTKDITLYKECLLHTAKTLQLNLALQKKMIHELEQENPREAKRGSFGYHYECEIENIQHKIMYVEQELRDLE